MQYLNLTNSLVQKEHDEQMRREFKLFFQLSRPKVGKSAATKQAQKAQRKARRKQRK